MTTIHTLPWASPGDDAFLEAHACVKGFQYPPASYTPERLDELIWRHWFVWWATTLSLGSTPRDRDAVLVECGVGNGITTHFALARARALRGDRFEAHLYDSWDTIRPQDLQESEQWLEGTYGDLSLERTLENLRPFSSALKLHPGPIPDSLSEDTGHPERVNYLFVGINSGKPTLAACEFFWQRLAPGAVVLFDDYGHPPFQGVRDAVNSFIAKHPGGIFTALPTGQALFLNTD